MWYTAALHFESMNKGNAGSPLWEESIILLEATSPTEARRKAEILATSREVEFETNAKDRVEWRFRRVERVFEVLENTVGDGTEVFSRFLRAEEVASLLKPFD